MTDSSAMSSAVSLPVARSNTPTQVSLVILEAELPPDFTLNVAARD